MMYLPRICEHCLNPACVASCPSGAMYKREEDGIVLVDQEKCRGWRMCVSGCPYKKVYFNWQTGKAEKCTLCYPRVEAGMPTVCSETCVGRIRYLGIVLYDADRVEAAASVTGRAATCSTRSSTSSSIRTTPRSASRPAATASPRTGSRPPSARPVWKLAMDWRIALPLHPEYRTLPMVWYIPPLSPVMSLVGGARGPRPTRTTSSRRSTSCGSRSSTSRTSSRAGDEDVVRGVLKRLAAMRAYMRADLIGGEPDPAIAARVGMTAVEIEDMYRLCAIAKYDDRYVIPLAHREIADNLEERQGGCGLDFAGGPGSCGPGVDTGEAEVDLVELAERGRGGLLDHTRSRRDGERAHERRRDGPADRLAAARVPRTASCSTRRRALRAAAATRPGPRRPRPARVPRPPRRDRTRGRCSEEYVATFDFHKRASLHLSYYRDGDRRQRGATLLGLKRRYREAGLELTGGELPDYLPAILEFAAFAPGEDADAILGRMRPGIELLRASLHDLDSPYAQRARRRRRRCCPR